MLFPISIRMRASYLEWIPESTLAVVLMEEFYVYFQKLLIRSTKKESNFTLL